jgi:hypothetical protein
LLDASSLADPALVFVRLRKSLEQHAADELELFSKVEPVLGNDRLELLGAEIAERWDDALAQGPEVTLARVDPRDLDWRAMRLRPRETRRTVPVRRNSEIRKDGAAALRHAARNKGGRRSPREDGRKQWKTGTLKMRAALRSLARWLGG